MAAFARYPDARHARLCRSGVDMGRRESGRGSATTMVLLLTGLVLALPLAIFLSSTPEVTEDRSAIVSNDFQRGDRERPRQAAAVDAPQQQADIAVDDSSELAPPPKNFSYLADYAYSEVPPDRSPAEIVLQSLADIPVGTPIDEIKLASDAFGLDFTFMKTVARIESGFDPKQRTGSYIGLFQLSNYEFAKYGSGSVTNPRDNAIAAAYKFTTEGILFELDTHKDPTRYDRYLIHQQGTGGAAEHVSHPEQIAWKSMCATEEGKEKGESWCKRAIWRNTLPDVKQIWKSVERLTSAGFVSMWQQRLDQLYAHYAAPGAPLPAVAVTASIPSSTPRPQIMLASPTQAKKLKHKAAV